jgi:hypothetical protein
VGELLIWAGSQSSRCKVQGSRKGPTADYDRKPTIFHKLGYQFNLRNSGDDLRIGIGHVRLERFLEIGWRGRRKKRIDSG